MNLRSATLAGRGAPNEIRHLFQSPPGGIQPAKGRITINPNCIGRGGGQDRPCDLKFGKKYPCSHINSTALIEQMSLFDTAIVMTNT